MKCNAPSIPNVSELLNGALRRNVIFDSSTVIYGKPVVDCFILNVALENGVMGDGVTKKALCTILGETIQ
ncbi:hypothetical protein [Okeania sp. KiyG1]|uniref:hypothetical protein n=1 Tax=Okeania sp. KiyG1 TaxID=2720165 RepID=UPI0019233AA4|nr:hypothetical protein [Okeania sp. KiyG1]GGA09067.1 hypothetical protein CYANOKiyG1_21870 [Okeania sp. KiyG1]